MKTVLTVVGVILVMGGLLNLALYVPYLLSGRDLGCFGTFIGVALLSIGVIAYRNGTRKEDHGGWDGPEW
ncbi:hypothetical protein [Gemmata sp.]|uniref:hypothetical protein n=1 Tax=Gemmata sp. TaxID=1914242 RepID=UPI003F722C13